MIEKHVNNVQASNFDEQSDDMKHLNLEIYKLLPLFSYQ